MRIQRTLAAERLPARAALHGVQTRALKHVVVFGVFSLSSERAPAAIASKRHCSMVQNIVRDKAPVVSFACNASVHDSDNASSHRSLLSASRKASNSAFQQDRPK